jgi:protein-disulfide isomerase
MKNKFFLISASIILIIGTFFIAKKMYQSKDAENLAVMAQTDLAKFVPDYAPTLGATNPEVYLVEFFDPECESCRDFYPLVKMLMNEFEGKVQLVMRYAPFHGNSKFAIKILEAARKQDKYWEALEVLFRYQPQWGSHHHPRPELIWQYLPEAGVDIEKIKTDMEDPAIAAMIEKEISDGQALGVRGTPHFFVNGKPLETFGLEPLRDLIRATLKK